MALQLALPFYCNAGGFFPDGSDGVYNDDSDFSSFASTSSSSDDPRPYATRSKAFQTTIAQRNREESKHDKINSSWTWPGCCTRCIDKTDVYTLLEQIR